ncbi:CHASE3 domain-containing protein, partial [Leptolyngbya sp. FACHB-36]|uniref:CHASE3 domain-containing protein n=1 Tax=Leptolyngbya sp. FACHB-36 TaxID=2692808 RepID=UPI001680E544|nr:CHASE3 domain-containing protein [Leptolyngbya sp. FACHB-36]
MVEPTSGARFRLAIVLLAIISISSWLAFFKFRQSSQWVSHTYQVLQETEELLSHLKDAETGQRGYLLTGRNNYLAPYDTAVLEIDRDMSELRRLTADNSRQQARLRDLQPLIDRKLDELRATIALRNQQGLSAALAVVKTDEGKQQMDQIRGVVDQIKQEEIALLSQRSLQANLDGGLSIGLVIVLSVVAIGVISAATSALRRYLSTLEQSEAEMRTLRDGLEVQVQERTTALLETLRSLQQQVQIREQAEAARDTSEDRFYRAILHAPLPMILHVEDGEVLQVNYAWTELSGYTLQDVPTIAHWTELAYGQRRATVQADINRLYGSDRRVSEGEYMVRTRSGSARIWEFFSAPLGPLPDGRRMVISAAIDVTERKQAEADRCESEEQFRQIAETIREVFWVTEPDLHKILYVSPAYEEIWGQPRDELYQDRSAWLRAIHPDDRPRIEATQPSKVLQGNYDEEYRIVQPSGNVRWIRDRAFLSVNDNRVQRITGIAEDITDRKRAEAEI